MVKSRGIPKGSPLYARNRFFCPAPPRYRVNPGRARKEWTRSICRWALRPEDDRGLSSILDAKHPGIGREFDDRSQRKLVGVHNDLELVAKLALKYSPVNFVITEGVRARGRQVILFQNGASKTMNSRHLTGHAIDVAAKIGGQISWDWPLYEKIADAFKRAARELDVKIKWGGDWASLRDGPHFELEWDYYPAPEAT